MIIDFRPSNSLRAQIVADIQSDIFKNREVGEKLPSEAEYAKQFKVTRSTIQKALKDLGEMNLINKVQGKGSFVAMKQPKVKMFNFKGFSDYARHIGAEPVTKVLSKKIEKAENTKYLILRRLRSIKTNTGCVPLTLDQSTLDLTTFPGLQNFNFETNSLYDVLRTEFRVNPMATTLRMSAITLDGKEAKQLDCFSSTPLLQANGTVFDSNNDVVEVVKIVYSQYAEFKINLGI